MSKENLVKLMQAAAEDEQLGHQWQSAGSYEDVKNLARGQGFDLGDLSAEAAARTIGVATGAVTEELSDKELETVAGGRKAYDLNPNDLSIYEGWPTEWLKQGKAT